MGKHLVQLYQVRYFSVTGHHNFLYVSMFQVSNTTARHGRWACYQTSRQVWQWGWIWSTTMGCTMGTNCTSATLSPTETIQYAVKIFLLSRLTSLNRFSFFWNGGWVKLCQTIANSALTSLCGCDQLINKAFSNKHIFFQESSYVLSFSPVIFSKILRHIYFKAKPTYVHCPPPMSKLKENKHSLWAEWGGCYLPLLSYKTHLVCSERSCFVWPDWWLHSTQNYGIDSLSYRLQLLGHGANLELDPPGHLLHFCSHRPHPCLVIRFKLWYLQYKARPEMKNNKQGKFESEAVEVVGDCGSNHIFCTSQVSFWFWIHHVGSRVGKTTVATRGTPAVANLDLTAVR